MTFKWVDENNVFRDEYEFDKNTNELSHLGKVIGETYNHFVAIVDDTGVIAYGYFEDTESSKATVKLNRRKLKNGIHRLYSQDVDLINSLHYGFNLEKHLLDEAISNQSTNQIYQECVGMFNELVVTDSNKLERLIGYSFDTADCYYMTKDCRGKITNHTGGGGVMRLKDNHDYDRWYSCFSYSNPPEPTFKFKLLVMFQ
jgi:hypothetical protein